MENTAILLKFHPCYPFLCILMHLKYTSFCFPQTSLWELMLKCLPSLLWDADQGPWPAHLQEGHAVHWRSPVWPECQSLGESGNKSNLTLTFQLHFLILKIIFFFFFIFPTKTCFLDRLKRNKTKHYPISCSQWHQWPVYVVEITHSSSFSVTKPCWSFRKMRISFFLSTSVTSYHEWKWRPSLHEVTQSLLGTISFSSAKPSHCSNFNSQCNLLPQ